MITELRVAGLIVRLAFLVTLPKTAVIVALVDDGTGDVAILKVALKPPAGTVTEAGTVADEELEFKMTDAPPVGAAPVRVIVPSELAPPVTAVGFKLREPAIAGVTVRVAVFVVPL